MGHLGVIILTLTCLYYVQATQVYPDHVDVEKFTAAESRSGPYKSYKDNLASPAAVRQQPSNAIYGKAPKAARPGPQPHAYMPPSIKGKPVVGKFKPSQEETSYDTENGNAFSQGYKPTPQETAALQKYMQRYASQVFNAQKHSAQLSDNQKHVISSDPYKKYVAPQKYKFTPFVPESMKAANLGERLKDYDTVEINTEKYQAQYQVQQQISVQPKSHPKRAYSIEAFHPLDEKENTKLAQQLFEEPEKSSWGYEPLQYGTGSTADKNSDLGKITGYKIPAAATSITLGHSVETKEEEKSHGGHEEEEHTHYPHHEPKYEYMYQVNDPEKENNFGHSEARKGKNTWGRYYVQLPDGRLETVKYWVDKSGYHAEVDFKGEAKHPSQHEYSHYEKEYQHQEHQQHQQPKSYPKFVEQSSGLGGHSDSFSIGDAHTLDEYEST